MKKILISLILIIVISVYNIIIISTYIHFIHPRQISYLKWISGKEEPLVFSSKIKEGNNYYVFFVDVKGNTYKTNNKYLFKVISPTDVLAKEGLLIDLKITESIE
jgi:hypothetical protein